MLVFVSIASSAPAKMRAAASAERSPGNLAGAGLGERDGLPHGIHRQRRVRQHQDRRPADLRHQRETLRVVRQFRVVARVLGESRQRVEQERVAVRRRFRSEVRSDQTIGAATVIDDELLLEVHREDLRERPHDDVGRAARCPRHDNTHRFRRPTLGMGHARRGERGDSQYPATGCLHGSLL
jgi:hypothetical protein